jgi:hypothetical protein
MGDDFPQEANSSGSGDFDDVGCEDPATGVSEHFFGCIEVVNLGSSNDMTTALKSRSRAP